jgi:hypothetical protein|tara:strand:- start:829 stop:1107 length:279 start_codon:yes stop_codon:yes gene_type:complete
MSNFETEYWNCVAPYKSKYEFIKIHFLIDIDETIKMLNKAKAEGNEKIVLDVMSKKADPNKFFAKRSIPMKSQTEAAKAHLPRAEAKEDLPF